ncbi:MAG TPA: hypothetical protein PKB06_01720, partial [Actinotalea sp.]|nr:hypothetical protein [Actinotalea sp.]
MSDLPRPDTSGPGTRPHPLAGRVAVLDPGTAVRRSGAPAPLPTAYVRDTVLLSGEPGVRAAELEAIAEEAAARGWSARPDP